MLSGNSAPPTKSPASKRSRGLSEDRSVKLALLLFLALDRDDLRALGRVMPGRAIHARDDFVDRIHAGSTTKVQSGDFSIRDLFVLRLASPNHEILTVGRAVVARAANRGQRLLSRVIIVRFDGHRTSVLVAFDGRAFDFLGGGELKLEALDDQELAEVWAGQK
jgi:hypothetical protein